MGNNSKNNSVINEKLILTEDRWREVYHLILSSQNRNINSSGPISTTKFLESFGINITETSIQSNLAFVLTPFHEDFKHTYEIISRACHLVKMTSLRGDEEFVSKDVLRHIIKCIVKAKVIIVNLNGRNPNVFYELGIAHALNKPTILSHIDNEVPFDLKNQYLVIYNNDQELLDRLQNSLLKILTIEN